MVGVRSSKIAEQRSAELAGALVERLSNSPRTEAYRRLDAEELRGEYAGFFRSLTEWLLYRRAGEIEEGCTQLGRRRAEQGIPLDQGVFAMLVCRDHLVELLRRESAQTHPSGLFGELEFVVAVNHFFDDAIFYFMRGYPSPRGEAIRVA